MKHNIYWLPFALIIVGLMSCVVYDQEVATEASTPESGNPKNEQLPNIEQSLSRKLKDALGRPARYEVIHRKSQGPWTFICGRPLEMNEKPFDYKNSKLSETYSQGLGDDSFCALMKGEKGQLEVIEFDIGSNDMPALEWIEAYEIPAEILDD